MQRVVAMETIHQPHPVAVCKLTGFTMLQTGTLQELQLLQQPQYKRVSKCFLSVEITDRILPLFFS